MSDYESRLYEIDHETACANNAAAHLRNSPHVIYGARISRDGAEWCAP